MRRVRRLLVVTVLLLAVAFVSWAEPVLEARYGDWLVLRTEGTLLDEGSWSATNTEGTQYIMYFDGGLRFGVLFEGYIATPNVERRYGRTVILATDTVGVHGVPSGFLVNSSLMVWFGSEATQLITTVYTSGSTKAQFRTTDYKGSHVDAYLDVSADARKALAFLVSKIPGGVE